MTKLTGSYNEYGYVIRKSSRVIYAAGNGAQGSQDYIGIHRGTLRKEAIPENANTASLEEIESFCRLTLTDMCDRPELHGLKGKCEAGKISYSDSLNPLEEAYKCGEQIR